MAFLPFLIVLLCGIRVIVQCHYPFGRAQQIVEDEVRECLTELARVISDDKYTTGEEGEEVVRGITVLFHPPTKYY